MSSSDQDFAQRLDILDNAILGVLEAEAEIDAALQTEDRPQLVRAVNEWRERMGRVRKQLRGAYEDLDRRAQAEGIVGPVMPRMDSRTADAWQRINRDASFHMFVNSTMTVLFVSGILFATFFAVASVVRIVSR